MTEEESWFGKVKYRILEGKKGVREAYDCMANSYDYSKYLYWTRKLEHAEERVVRKWIDDFSGPCLDVGCGTGRYSLKIAEKDVEVVTSDFSLPMLKRLRLKAKGSGIYHRIHVVLADASIYPSSEAPSIR